MGERETEQLGYLVLELVVRAEHRLAAKDRVADDLVDVEEQFRESTREVRKEAVGHRPQQALHVVRQVLIMMFLHPARISHPAHHAPWRPNAPYSAAPAADPARSARRTCGTCLGSR